MAGLAVLGAFALLSILFTGLFPPFTNPNELSRFEAVYAVVENGTFAIDEAIRLFGDHEDKAVSGGHFYSNKAPGLAFAAIPVYRALRLFFPRPGSSFDPVFVWTRFFTVTLICLAAVAALLRRLRPSPEGPLVSFALVFGTPFLFYGRSFFSHAWTASLLFLAWDLLRRREEEPPRRGTLGDAAAGVLAGWAAISEYTVAPLAVLLAFRAARRGSWRRLFVFGAGAAVPLLLLLLYDAACFGSPWVLSSAREADREYAQVSREGLFGFGPPSLHIAGHYFVHRARGILLRSPFWLWLVPGFLAWWRSKRDRTECVFTLVSIAGFFLLLTGYENWHGGWSLGNRYLLPVLFFTAPALARAVESPLSRGLFILAMVFSAVSHFLLTSSFPHFPSDVRFPVGNASLWFLRRGWFAPRVVPSPGWIVFLLAFLLVAAAGVLALRAARPAVPAAPIAAAAALLLLAASVAVSPELPYGAKLWRAGMYASFSGLDPDRKELKKVMPSAASASERSQAIGAWKVYGR